MNLRLILQFPHIHHFVVRLILQYLIVHEIVGLRCETSTRQIQKYPDTPVTLTHIALAGLAIRACREVRYQMLHAQLSRPVLL